MNRHYQEVAHRANHRCEYCLAPEVLFNFPFEVEHITPLSEGGKNLLYNLALACRACNLFKAAYLLFLDPNTQELVRLFNPRLDNWSEHFHIDLVTAEIVGQTPVGRATVQCLRSNSVAQTTARKQWIRIELYP